MTMISICLLSRVDAVGEGPYTVKFVDINIPRTSKFLSKVTRIRAVRDETGKEILEEPKMVEDILILPCYIKGTYKITACYDHEMGLFIEFNKNVICSNEICYYLRNTTGGTIDENLMNLKSANIENLKKIIMAEQMKKSETILI